MALAPVSGYSMSAWGWQKDIRTQTWFHHGSPPYTQPIKYHLMEMLTQLRWVSWSCNHFPKITLETYHTHTHTHQFPKCIKELCSMFMQPSALLTQQKLKCELKVPWQWSRCAIENALMIDLWWQLLREDPNYFSFRDGWLWGRDFCCKTSHCKCA